MLSVIGYLGPDMKSVSDKLGNKICYTPRLVGLLK
jgi:hypothetical protein